MASDEEWMPDDPIVENTTKVQTVDTDIRIIGAGKNTDRIWQAALYVLQQTNMENAEGSLTVVVTPGGEARVYDEDLSRDEVQKVVDHSMKRTREEWEKVASYPLSDTEEGDDGE
jgi:hypothetical protein